MVSLDLKLTVAKSFVGRTVGLLGKSYLPSDEGLLIVPCNSVHTLFMRFAIDAIFLNARGIILSTHHLRPYKIAFERRATSCLELAAGEVNRRKLLVGMQINLKEGTTQVV